jgi:putative protease
MKQKIELLSPAGDMEKFKMALAYGADGVYLAGQRFGLRAYAGNFNEEELKQAVDMAHKQNKKVYVTMNMIPHNQDFDGMEQYVAFLYNMEVDAIIVSDPGIIALAQEVAPELELHLSTQANCVNSRSANYWHRQGIKRVVLARELSLEQIKEIRDNTPESLELEAFVHGAMCIAYSGRCLMSNYMAYRSGNRGECAQPCRWEYDLVEKKRPDQAFGIGQDESGTYVFNSKDLCMINHLQEVINAGITSLKIEGRMKSAYYTACVTGVYRQELDRIAQLKEEYQPLEASVEELDKVSHRPYTTAFYFGKPDESTQEYHVSKYVRNYDFVAKVIGFDAERQWLKLEQRNHFKKGDVLELIAPNQDGFINIPVDELYNQEGEAIEKAPHPQQTVYIPVPFQPFEGMEAAILRKQVIDNVQVSQR